MDMDALLMQELGKFIQCSHHALYFPTTHAPRQPELLPRERRLLLPLYRDTSRGAGRRGLTLKKAPFQQ